MKINESVKVLTDNSLYGKFATSPKRKRVNIKDVVKELSSKTDYTEDEILKLPFVEFVKLCSIHKVSFDTE